jgi:hypothetical protein
MPKTRKEEMREQVATFHRRHPEVWDLFAKYTLQMIAKGFNHYSAKAIFERIRWEKDLGGDGKTQFKLNNNYTAFYARRFGRAYPQHEGFFRNRKQTSEDSRETNLPELTPTYYEDNYRCLEK